MSVTSNQTPICGTILKENITSGMAVGEMDTGHLLAPLDKLVSGTLIFFVVLPFVLFNFRFFPIGSTPSLLIGAAFMVFAHVVPQDEVYQIVGRQDNLTFMYLVIGLMLIVQFFDREQLLTTILRHALKSHLTFENYIWRVSLISFVLSAFFTSDVCGAILTPILLKFWEVQERQHTELETIVLAIATSANIGSATTIFGSAHIALLASKTTELSNTRSILDLRHCLLYLLPAAVLVFLINLGFLICHYRLRSRDIQKSKLISEASTSEQEMSGLTRTHGSGDLTKLNGTLKPTNGVLRYNGGDEITFEEDNDSIQDDRLSVPCHLETIPEDEVLEITSSRSVSALDNDAISGSTPEHTYPTMENEETSTFNGSGSSDEEEPRNTVHAQSTCDTILEESNSLTMDIEYRPSALQSQDFSCRSGGIGSPEVATPTKSLEKQGLRLSEKGGIYRSLSAVSAIGFLPAGMGIGTTGESCPEGPFPASNSKLFQAFISFMLVVVVALNLASSSEAVIFDIGNCLIHLIFYVITNIQQDHYKDNVIESRCLVLSLHAQCIIHLFSHQIITKCSKLNVIFFCRSSATWSCNINYHC